MFRVLTLLSVALVTLWVIVRRRSATPNDACLGPAGSGRFPWLERLCAFAVCAASVILTLTGFVPALLGRPLSGYALLVHTALGGLLAVTFAGLLLLRGQRYGPRDRGGAEGVSVGRKLLFWLMAVSLLALIVPVLSAMVPMLDTHGQHAAIDVHRYAALVFLLASIVYAGLRKR